MGFGVGDLKHVLGVDDADDIVDGVAVDGDARERALTQEFDQLLDGGVDRDGQHVRAGLHGLAHGLAAEFDNRLNEGTVAGLDDAFLLASFDQGVNRLGRAFRLLFGGLAGQGRDRLQEAEREGNG